MKPVRLIWAGALILAVIVSSCLAQGPLVTNVFYDTDLREALQDITAQTGINIIPDDTVQGIITLEVFDMPLEQCLERMLAPLGYTFRKMDGYYIVGAPHPQNLSFPLLSETTLYTPNYIRAQDVAALLSDYYQPYVKINPSTNTIAITTSPEMTRSILEDLAKIDVPAKQVMIEAIVTEMSKDVARNLGLDWDLWGSNDKGTRFDIEGRNSRHRQGSGGDSALSVFVERLDRRYGSFDVSMSVRLRALEDQGQVDIRANPRLATVNGRTASIFIGREEYYSIITGPVNYPYTRLELIQVGITLNITPYVAEDGNITVEIKPEVSDVTGTGATELPVVSKRSVDTKIRVKNGETITVGGLRGKQERTLRTGVPFLSSIPILGYLFRHDTHVVEEREVVVFITPKIMED
jgi:type II secretory pathway component GspD/PulD (secretin)